MDDVKQWIDTTFVGEKRWNGDWKKVICPFHDDHNPSCSVNAKDRGFFCHVCKKKGTLKQLADKKGVPYPFQQSPKYQKTVTSDGIQYEAQGKTYSQYQDETGKIVYKSVRHYPNGVKKFYTDPKGVKTSFPYRLPEVMKAISEGKEIIITEGEKDVETLRSMGFVATTNHGGTGMGLGVQHSKWFKNAYEVFICGDADVPGKKHADKVAQSSIDVGCKVKVIDLGYEIIEKHGKDISDWVSEGHTKEEFQKLLSTAKDWKEQSLEPTEKDIEILSHGLTAKQLDAKVFPKIRWIIERLMTEGLTVLAGKSGSGKSYLGLQLACCLSAGVKLFGKFPVEKMHVLYLSMEDDIRIAKQRRQECTFPLTDNLMFYENWPTGTEGLRLLEIYCEQHKPGLVIIDTWSWFRGMEFASRMNADGYHEIVQELALYKETAKKSNTSIIILHHLTKNPSPTGDPHDAILGSTAIRATCDTRLTLEYKADKTERTLHVQGRMVPAQAHVINLSNEGWSYVSDKAEYAQTTERQEILDVLHTTDAMSPKEISDSLDKNRSTVRGLVMEMEHEGLISRKGHGRYVRT